MQLLQLFNDLNDSIPKVREKQSEDINVKTFPIRDSTTLNLLLYKNEKYNKRNLPQNDDKKPLYEIVKIEHIGMNDLNSMIDKDIHNMKSKTWTQIPINIKKNLIDEYCKKNDIEISELKLKTILKDRTLVKYSKKNQCIENIKL